MRSRYPSGLAVMLDRELEQMDRYLHGRGIPADLDAERAAMLLVRAQERRREAYDRISEANSLQHGGGLINAVAHGMHPAMVFERGRRAKGEALGDEFQEQRRIRYLEQILPSLRAQERSRENPAPPE